MEKPKNYWLRAYIANISAALCLIPSIILAVPIMYHFVELTLPILLIVGVMLVPICALVVIFMGPLSIAKGIKFKDWKYIIFGIIPLATIFIAFLILLKNTSLNMPGGNF